MKSKTAGKALAVCLSAVLISLGCVSPAFAYNYYKQSSIRTWNVDPTYKSYNAGAYDQMGYYFADCYSFMNVANTSRSVQAGAVTSQAGITVGRSGNETMHWGTAKTNTGQNAAWNYINSTLQVSITYGQGASAWGYGKVRSANLVMNDVTTDNIYLLTLTETGIYSVSDPDNALSSWQPGASNFTGDDGLVYGVPYADEEGCTVMPDMGRVEATNGMVGYIDVSAMDEAILNGAHTEAERAEEMQAKVKAEAELLQEAFVEKFGIDALDYDSAYQCMNDIRYEGAEKSAFDAVRKGVSRELALKKVDWLRLADCALFAGFDLGSDDTLPIAFASTEKRLSDEALTELVENVEGKMLVTMPVYSNDGVTIIGEYQFASI